MLGTQGGSLSLGKWGGDQAEHSQRSPLRLGLGKREKLAGSGGGEPSQE